MFRDKNNCPGKQLFDTYCGWNESQQNSPNVVSITEISAKLGPWGIWGRQLRVGAHCPCRDSWMCKLVIIRKKSFLWKVSGGPGGRVGVALWMCFNRYSSVKGLLQGLAQAPGPWQSLVHWHEWQIVTLFLGFGGWQQDSECSAPLCVTMESREGEGGIQSLNQVGFFKSIPTYLSSAGVDHLQSVPWCIRVASQKREMGLLR